MNKSQLIDELADRFGGNKRVATHALESVVDVITRSVSAGEKVVITGFGAFERTVRKAGVARNPRTGASVKTRKKFVPRFRPGSELKEVVSGARKAPKRVAQSFSLVPETAATGLRAAAGVARGAMGEASGTTRIAAARTSTAKKTTASASSAAKKSTGAKKTSAAKKSTGAKKTSAAKKSTGAKKTSAAKKSTGAKKTSAA
ncbi:MAG: integration host factor subunit beta, partial [Jiangellaceae bacterium]|nr:integration host factor subunit beta [Jiangellaceae bacterium]